MAPDFDISNSSSTQDLSQEQFQVIEQKPDHHFRTEIPNIVDDLDLDPYEFRIYHFIKKIAGDSGLCWHCIKSMCKKTKVKETKAKQVLKKLASPFALLGGRPLIEIRHRKKPDGSNDTNLINIVPIWRQNGDYFRGVGRQTTQGGGSPNDPCGSPNDYKEEPYIKEPIQQQGKKNSAAAAIYPSLEKIPDSEVSQAEKKRISSKYDEVTVNDAVARVTQKDFTPEVSLLKSLNAACKNSWKPEKTKQQQQKDKKDAATLKENLRDMSYCYTRSDCMLKFVTGDIIDLRIASDGEVNKIFAKVTQIEVNRAFGVKDDLK